MNRCIRLLLSGLLLLMLLIGAVSCALAADLDEEFQLTRDGAVLVPVMKNNRYHLFVPGTWVDGQPIALKATSAIWIGGEEYQNGDPLPAFAEGDTWTVSVGRKNYQAKNVQLHIGSPLPALFINTESGSTSAIHNDKTVKEPADYLLFEPEKAAQSGRLEYIKGRGNTTFDHPKKPYQIKFPKKKSMLGMGTAKKWVLLADYWDISLLRNRITLDLAKAAGMRYTPASAHVDLYLNGRYRGLYLMTEKIEVSQNSVSIRDLQKELEEINASPLETYKVKELRKKNGDKTDGFTALRGALGMANPEDITGGYLLETDKTHRFYSDTYAGFITKDGMAVAVKEPENASMEMVQYIGGMVNAFHRSLLTRDGVDPQTGKRWDDLFDKESLAQKYLIEEFSENFDAMTGSQFFYKDADYISDKIFAGPSWDYDLTYGNAQHQPNRLYLRIFAQKHDEYWYNHLHKFDDFEELLAQTWRDTFSPLANALAGNTQHPSIRSVAEYGEEIRASAEMNFVLWSIKNIEGRHKGTGYDFSSAVEFLQEYVGKRAAWLDNAFSAE